MLIKSRLESNELRCLRSLNVRMNLSPKEKQTYLYLEKGFKGERKFDNWISNLSGDSLILNDLLLDTNNSMFQIDSFILNQNKVYLFEVKNYEGDFYIDGEKWLTMSGVEIKNPLLQLKRSESLLRQTIQPLSGNLLIKAYLIFVNPEFTLYNASSNLPIIFPTQMNQFMKKWNNMNSSPLTQQHKNLAKSLVSMHLEESPHTRLPTYDYGQLKKGVLCPLCSAFLMFRGKTLVCKECGNKEDGQTGVLRNVEEFKLLFPTRKVTTGSIFNWCGMQGDPRRINRILGKNFNRSGKGKGTHYVKP